MADDLKEIYERLDYCESEIKRVGDEAYNFMLANVEQRVRTEGGRQFHEARCLQPIPMRIRSRIGTIGNEIRACLDELTSRLAERNGKSANGANFPIIKHAADYETEAKKMLKNLSEADRGAIIALGTHAEKRPFLYGMHDVDRVRKHQRSFVSAVAMISGGVNGPGSLYGITLPGAEPIGPDWTTVISADARTTMVFNYEVAVSFHEPEQIRGTAAVIALWQFAGEVREIVRLFD